MLINKDVFREIKKSAGRFISLLLIVALGVAFYAGIRSCHPDMLITADHFYDEAELMDFSVMSTLGLTDEDVEAVKNVPGIKAATGNYSADFVSKSDEKQSVLKVTAITDNVNQIVIVDGRLPEKAGEAVIDIFYRNVYEIKTGEKLRLESGDDTDISDVLKSTEYTIVGCFSSPRYLSMDYGTTSIGSGKVDGCVYVLPEDFALDVYTEMYVQVEGAAALQSYSEEYDETIEEAIKGIEDIASGREKARYDKVVGDATERLNEAKADLEEGKKKLEDARQEIADAKQEIDDAKKQVEDGKKELEDGRKLLEDKRKELADGKAELADNKALLADSKKQLSVKKNEFNEGKTEYEEKAALLAETKVYLANLREKLGPLADLVPELVEGEKELAAAEEELAKGKALLDAGESEIKKAEAQIKAYDRQIANAEQLIRDGEQAIIDGEAEIAENEQKIKDAEAEIADGEKELADAEAKIPEAEEEIKDGELKIADAEAEIADIDYPEWYVLEREKCLQEYASYRSDADRIGNLGKVFPLIFFIVAALVCLTTMTRMVDAERTQIGMLKALGYSKWTIASKYITYAFLATVFGSVIGALVGSKVLPYVIINVYKILYPNLDGLYMPYSAEHCLTASLAAFVCIMAATLFSCFKALMDVPANLMRPLAPKKGRKLLLERIKPLWRKIPFNWKNAFRNFVRYKKRLFMTLFGIIGSTALLLVGFGINDAVNTILYTQFGGINLYDQTLSIDGKATDDEIAALDAHLAADERVSEYSFAYQSIRNASCDSSDEELEVYIYITEDMEHIDSFISLRTRVGQEKVTLNDEKVAISEKMASVMDLKVGDELYLAEDKGAKTAFKVGAIVENYTYHYVYMTPALYEKAYGEPCDYRQIVVVNRDDVDVDDAAFAEEYLAEPAVGGVMAVSTMIEKFADVISGMSSITVVLIICAGALTFVVLYNLNNINVTERQRELATLKVLGFYNTELTAYIIRENILITIIGVAIGVVCGILLNRFVVESVEVDIVMFGRQIYPLSYLWSVLIAVGFTAIVNFLVHFKLKKIDMATSLKSVE